MAIYDCFQFFDEEHVLDIRLNVLNEFVDYFVIVESTSDHQGNHKELNFDIFKFKKFKNKIIYLVYDKQPNKIEKILETDSEDITNWKYISHKL